MNDDETSSDDPVKVYLAVACDGPPLRRDEEISCVQHVRAGDEQAGFARHRLVEGNVRLVVSIAERYQNEHIHTLDLIQKGNDGLLHALQTFNYSREDMFS